MIRRAEHSGAIHLIKYPTAESFADITTKPLTGAPFSKHRASVLGLPPPPSCYALLGNCSPTPPSPRWSRGGSTQPTAPQLLTPCSAPAISTCPFTYLPRTEYRVPEYRP
jgi:hypothetical protein